MSESKRIKRKYNKDYCQKYLDDKNIPWTVVDFIDCENSKDNRIILQCQNKNHKIKEMSIEAFQRSNFICSECNIENKIKEIKIVVENKGYELLNYEYHINGNYILHLSDGIFKYRTCYNNISKNGRLNICSATNPYSSENVEKYIDINNIIYEFISVGYNENNKFVVFCKCKNNTCNEVFDILFYKLQNGRGCPFCNGRRVNKNNSFYYNYQELAKEWDYKKNIGLDINNFTCGSMQSVWWICSKHNVSWKAHIRDRVYGHGCKECKNDAHRGENNHNWSGGTTPIFYYLRKSVDRWKFESADISKSKCVITNKRKSTMIHHLNKPFLDIAIECFKDLNIDIKRSISEYSDKELDAIKTLCLEKHYKYGYGVCINSSLHKEFHKIYGLKSNTREQFIEFAKSKGVKNIDKILEDYLSSLHPTEAS